MPNSLACSLCSHVNRCYAVGVVSLKYLKFLPIATILRPVVKKVLADMGKMKRRSTDAGKERVGLEKSVIQTQSCISEILSCKDYKHEIVKKKKNSGL